MGTHSHTRTGTRENAPREVRNPAPSGDVTTPREGGAETARDALGSEQVRAPSNGLPLASRAQLLTRLADSFLQGGESLTVSWERGASPAEKQEVALGKQLARELRELKEQGLLTPDVLRTAARTMLANEEFDSATTRALERVATLATDRQMQEIVAPLKTRGQQALLRTADDALLVKALLETGTVSSAFVRTTTQAAKDTMYDLVIGAEVGGKRITSSLGKQVDTDRIVTLCMHDGPDQGRHAAGIFGDLTGMVRTAISYGRTAFMKLKFLVYDNDHADRQVNRHHMERGLGFAPLLTEPAHEMKKHVAAELVKGPVEIPRPLRRESPDLTLANYNRALDPLIGKGGDTAVEFRAVTVPLSDLAAVGVAHEFAAGRGVRRVVMRAGNQEPEVYKKRIDNFLRTREYLGRKLQELGDPDHDPKKPIGPILEIQGNVGMISKLQREYASIPGLSFKVSA